MPVDAGAIVCCKCCGSYWLAIVGTAPTPAELGGGKRAQEGHIEALSKLQDASLCASDNPTLLACPTCAELATGLSFDDYVRGRGDAVLTHCTAVQFADDEPAPLYCLDTHGKGKARWALRQGLGPQTLDLDKKSRSTKIYAGSLRQYGLPMPPRPETLVEEGGGTEAIAAAIAALEALEPSAARALVAPTLLLGAGAR